MYIGGIMYYNGAGVLNSGCPINFSIGNRSTGKSFYWKRYCIKRFIEAGKQFIYIRRNIVDIDVVKNTWFDDIGQKFPGYSLDSKDHEFYLRKDGKVELCGYYYALTEIKKLKSIVFEKVETIFFDEFLPDDNKYLKPSEPSYEPELLLSLFFTVARGYKTPIREDVRLIASANNVTMYNPYFSFFKIDLSKVNKQKVNYVYAESILNESIRDEILKSKFGQILKSTGYGKYALNNKSLYSYDRHISKIPKGAYLWCMIYCFDWYMVFADDDGSVYIKEGYDSSFKKKFRITDDCPEDVTKFKGDIVKLFKKLYEQDKIYYSSSKVKSQIAGFIEL